MERSRAPELWRILVEVETMDANEVHRIMLHADAYAFGLLVSEILTGCIPESVYKDGVKRYLDICNVGLKKGWNVVGNDDGDGLSISGEFSVEEGRKWGQWKGT